MSRKFLKSDQQTSWVLLTTFYTQLKKKLVKWMIVQYKSVNNKTQRDKDLDNMREWNEWRQRNKIWNMFNIRS